MALLEQNWEEAVGKEQTRYWDLNRYYDSSQDAYIFLDDLFGFELNAPEEPLSDLPDTVYWLDITQPQTKWKERSV